MPFTIVSQGTFTQPTTAVSQIINLPTGCDYFKTYNYTKAIANAPTGAFMGEWFGGGITANNDGIRWSKNGSTAVLVDNFQNAASNPTGGFTYITSFPQPQAALTGTTITKATAAVASVVNTYSNGDQVIIYNAVGMQQISGMIFTISSVSGTQFTLLGLNSSAFATAATSFMVRRITQNPVGVITPVAPPSFQITAVTNAVGAQVTTSQANDVFVGQKLEFTVPASFGMVQLNNYYQAQSKPIIVNSIIDPYNFTINIDTTNYTAFALPASSGSPTTQLFATCAPAGQATTYNPVTNVTTGYNFTQAPFRSGLFLPCMLINAGQFAPGGQANEVIVWEAFKMETGTINSPVPS
jgi:hypothetical protein